MISYLVKHCFFNIKQLIFKSCLDLIFCFAVHARITGNLIFFNNRNNLSFSFAADGFIYLLFFKQTTYTSNLIQEKIYLDRF